MTQNEGNSGTTSFVFTVTRSGDTSGLATVNYATEKANVRFGDGVTHDDLIAQVEKAGYTAALPAPTPAEPEDGHVRALRDRLLVSALLTVPVIALAMVPALQFTSWPWVWAGWRARPSTRRTGNAWSRPATTGRSSAAASTWRRSWTDSASGATGLWRRMSDLASSRGAANRSVIPKRRGPLRA